MSYASILKNIPDFLSQPTGIAAITSIGIHGAIAFILPLMPVDSKSKPVTSSKAVGVVELSQAEQQRLPQTSIAPKVALQPQIPIQKINSTLPNQTTLPPLPPSSSTSLILPQLPKSTTNYSTYSLPRFNPGNIYRPYTSTTPTFTRRRRIYNPPTTPSYANPSKWKNNDTAPALAGIDDNKPSTTQKTAVNNTNKAPSRNLLAPVKSAFEPGSNYTIAATGSFREFKPQSPDKNTAVTPTPYSGKEIAALNSYQDLRQGILKAYPGITEKAAIRQVISTDNSALHGNVRGILVVDAEAKVLDVVFQSDKFVSPAQKVATRKHFSKNPPPNTKNIASYPFSLNLKDVSNVANTNTQPVTPNSSRTSLEQKLRRNQNQNQNQKETAANRPVRIKTPIQVPTVQKNQNEDTKKFVPVGSSPKNQPETSAGQPVKIKTPSQLPTVQKNQQNQQAANSEPSRKKLINRLRQVRDNRQNQQ
ncbi:hypothetical protein RintRC_0192 [Richelia intracellularis]|nr:hypothetical protein RintRC_0192 [Richelia intracellularis]